MSISKKKDGNPKVTLGSKPGQKTKEGDLSNAGIILSPKCKEPDVGKQMAGCVLSVGGDPSGKKKVSDEMFWLASTIKEVESENKGTYSLYVMRLVNEVDRLYNLDNTSKHAVGLEIFSKIDSQISTEENNTKTEELKSDSFEEISKE